MDDVYISGPVSARIYYDPESGRRVYLFGDHHYSRAEGCKSIYGTERATKLDTYRNLEVIQRSKYHYTIEALLKLWSERSPIKTDFYIEIPLLTSASATVKDLAGDSYASEIRARATIRGREETKAMLKSENVTDVVESRGHMGMLGYVFADNILARMPLKLPKQFRVWACDGRQASHASDAPIRAFAFHLIVNDVLMKLLNYHNQDHILAEVQDIIRSTLDMGEVFFEAASSEGGYSRMITAIGNTINTTSDVGSAVMSRLRTINAMLIPKTGAVKEGTHPAAFALKSLEGTNPIQAAKLLDCCHTLFLNKWSKFKKRALRDLDDPKNVVNLLMLATAKSHSPLMDIYTLAKILQRNDSQNVIVFAGDAHIAYYDSFFGVYLGHILEYEDLSVGRCIRIPRAYVDWL